MLYQPSLRAPSPTLRQSICYTLALTRSVGDTRFRLERALVPTFPLSYTDFCLDSGATEGRGYGEAAYYDP